MGSKGGPWGGGAGGPPGGPSSGASGNHPYHHQGPNPFHQGGAPGMLNIFPNYYLSMKTKQLNFLFEIGGGGPSPYQPSSVGGAWSGQPPPHQHSNRPHTDLPNLAALGSSLGLTAATGIAGKQVAKNVICLTICLFVGIKEPYPSDRLWWQLH